MESVTAIGPTRINKQGGDIVTVKVGPEKGIVTTLPDGTKRPAIPDDVVSVSPDGKIEGRVAGTANAYERAVQKPDRVIFAPLGSAGNVYIFPYVDELPND